MDTWTCKKRISSHGSEYRMEPVDASHVRIADFRAFDYWAYTFYDKSGQVLGQRSVEVTRGDKPPTEKAVFRTMLSLQRRSLNRLEAVAGEPK